MTSSVSGNLSRSVQGGLTAARVVYASSHDSLPSHLRFSLASSPPSGGAIPPTMFTVFFTLLPLRCRRDEGKRVPAPPSGLALLILEVRAAGDKDAFSCPFLPPLLPLPVLAVVPAAVSAPRAGVACSLLDCLEKGSSPMKGVLLSAPASCA